jgi:predicted ATPase
VVHEAARTVIDRGMRSGLTAEQVRADAGAFEHRILREKLRLESRLSSGDRVFFDRAMPDSIAYFRLAGLDPTPALDACRLHRYHRVFFFERLPFRPDGARTESDDTAGRIESLLRAAYRELGYRPVWIPAGSVVDRCKRVLEVCKGPL